MPAALGLTDEQVLTALALFKNNRKAAKYLNCCEDTVRFHKSKIARDMGLTLAELNKSIESIELPGDIPSMPEDKIKPGCVVMSNGRKHVIKERLDSDGHIAASPIVGSRVLWRTTRYIEPNDYRPTGEVRKLDIPQPPKPIDFAI